MGTVKLYDVVVIGGGPSGSQVANRLAGMGYDVVVIEQKKKLDEPVCCTGIISRECADSFAVDEDIVLRWVNSARIISPSGRVLKVWRPEPQACIVDRAAFNAALAKQAMARGVEYVLSSRVRGIKVENEGVNIEIDGRDGHFNLFKARVAVIAAGSGSRLVEGLGLGKVSEFIMGAQADVQAIDVDEVEIYLGKEIAPDFFAWLVPTSPQRALVGLLSRHRPGHYLKRLIDSLVAQGRIASVASVLSYGGLNLKPLARTYSDRMIVVGGAAGQVKPTTGGGIYYSMLCADIAADVLNKALESDTLLASHLARYQRKWKARLGQELRVGYWARKMYELLSDAQIDRLLDIMNTSGINKALSEADDLSFDWHSGVVLRLLSHQALAKVSKLVKVPLPSGLRGKGSVMIDT